jgi:hypothetical protein
MQKIPLQLPQKKAYQLFNDKKKAVQIEQP